MTENELARIIVVTRIVNNLELHLQQKIIKAPDTDILFASWRLCEKQQVTYVR